MKTKDMCFIAIMTALLCIAAPLSVPVEPIPITLATFVMYLASGILGCKRGTVAVVLYVLLGVVGLPVFAQHTAGFARLAGATGGYIVGFIPMAALIGFMVEKWNDKKWMVYVAMAAGTVLLYVIGTAWFMLQTKNTLAASMGMCVIPFLPGDALKIAAAGTLTLALREPLKKVMQ